MATLYTIKMEVYDELEKFPIKDFAQFRPCTPYLSDNETICSFCSINEGFSQNYEQELDNQLEKYAFLPVHEYPKVQKRRGRKPLRPNDPIKKKTEIKDKYWLRAFRNFVKSNFSLIKKLFTIKQLEFWICYISKSGKPGKDSAFLSYGKKYKEFLYSGSMFLDVFRAWFLEYGEYELLRRYKRDSDLWFIYYDYALKEIANGGTDSKIFREALQKNGKLDLVVINNAII